MHLEFFGAAGEVTGSCHIVHVGSRTLLLDCGMIRGGDTPDERNRQAFPFARPRRARDRRQRDVHRRPHRPSSEAQHLAAGVRHRVQRVPGAGHDGRGRPTGTQDRTGSARLNPAALINARPHEVRGAVLAFLCAFFMFSGYTILRPIRETMGITSGVSTLPALFWERSSRCCSCSRSMAGWRRTSGARSSCRGCTCSSSSTSSASTRGSTRRRTTRGSHVPISSGSASSTCSWSPFSGVSWPMSSRASRRDGCSASSRPVSSVGGLLGPLLGQLLAERDRHDQPVAARRGVRSRSRSSCCAA